MSTKLNLKEIDEEIKKEQAKKELLKRQNNKEKEVKK